MLSEIKEIFLQKINNLLDLNFKNVSEGIIFFQGFPQKFYEVIQHSRLSHFNKSYKKEYIDYKTIDVKSLFAGLTSCNGLCWGYYEELITLNKALNNINLLYKGKVFVVKNNLFDVYYPIDVPISGTDASSIYERETGNDEDTITAFYSDFKTINDTPMFSYVNNHYDIDTETKIKEIDFFKIPKGKIKYPEEVRQIEISTNDLILLKKNLIFGELEKGVLYIIKSLDNKLVDDFLIMNSIGNSLKIFFRLDDISRGVKEKEALRHINIFRKHWGERAEFYNRRFYRDPSTGNETIHISQGSLITDIIDQCELAMKNKKESYSDIVITAPTGAGKSLFFQVPAIYLHEKYKAVTIVICPLVALMTDQVNELHERGVSFATFINSDISFEERQDRREGIIEGRYSIVYLSPELLLAYDIRNIIGDRRIGLMVIDEAHLVTSWGRDFRVDYWFLGDYLEKIRRGNYFNKNRDKMNFPIICLTATAVYGGRDDVVQDLQKSLHLNCSSEHLYLGYVKRDNISFKINQATKKSVRSQKQANLELTIKRVKEFIKNNEKTIIYFPYVSQIEDVCNKLKDYSECEGVIERYSGSGMNSLEKNISYERYRASEAIIMLATKAFGMGVNISDVLNVYHYAPTGTLADYVQEIGRAARKLEKGYAIIDYLANDMHYAKTLWGLSGLRHYQIQAIIKKLYDLYQIKGSRNLLFSPDTFSYLFDAKSCDMKVKSGLMLLSADLLDKYHFRVINVRPKNLFSNQFIVVPKKIEKEFMREFAEYCTLMTDDKPKAKAGYGSQGGLIVYNNGNVYEINLAKVWEDKFDNLTFAKFKYYFFNGDLFSYGTDRITPRIKLIINYEKGYDMAKNNLLNVASAVQKTFNYLHKLYGGKEFSFKEFSEIFGKNYGKKIRKEYIIILLDVFCYERTDIYDIPNEQWKFIERRKGEGNGQFNEKSYCIRTSKHGYIEQNMKRYIAQAYPNSEDRKTFTTYLTIPNRNGKYSEYQLVASLLELFNFATFDLIGGRNPQIFVRVNDPLKLKRIADSDKAYRNRILTNIEDRHKRAAIIVDKFMKAELDDDGRWAVIENYFLGFDGVVDGQLGIQ